ncbi:MAG: nucleotidyltransferase family protein [Sedimentisphaerales bacterium]|jgi:hypothetical protein|nr:nucleotidyltransferase family protein [Sedimentisphaerales bacterium]
MLNRLQDVFRSFQQHNVKYVIIGGIASTLYGVPRATFDLDILIEATLDNAKRLLDALLDARLGTASLTTAEDLLSHEITIFKDKVRIDVQTSTPGVSFQDAWQRRQIMNYQGQQFYVLSKDDLISSKRAAGREVDLEDVRLLELAEDKETTEQEGEPETNNGNKFSL